MGRGAAYARRCNEKSIYTEAADYDSLLLAAGDENYPYFTYIKREVEGVVIDNYDTYHYDGINFEVPAVSLP